MQWENEQNAQYIDSLSVSMTEETVISYVKLSFQLIIQDAALNSFENDYPDGMIGMYNPNPENILSQMAAPQLLIFVHEIKLQQGWDIGGVPYLVLFFHK